MGRSRAYVSLPVNVDSSCYEVPHLLCSTRRRPEG
jgi:hypothetical protein